MNKKQIVFVTSNLGKIKSAQRELEDVEVIQYNLDLVEPRSDNIKEISKVKAMQAYNIVKKPCISMDSGFFIEELNGFPRAYVNYALETVGIEGILKLMECKENRNCKFKECLVYYDGNNINFFEAETKGKLSNEIRGSDNKQNWSKLSYIFEVKEVGKTIAELNDTEREKYLSTEDQSCFKKFIKWYLKNEEKLELK
ncbi:MAG: non-canonical purine NTP pyrophosphatase [Clostridium sp.]|uniref:non-canonical purine NTP pyrophosphatase n=1 Tax=Clostridium sp. TaxID=1506 RepID=UPI003D6CFCB5